MSGAVAGRMGRLVVVVAVLIALTSGCGIFSKGAYDVPLPGGADLGSSPYKVSAQFDDVLDLVPQSSVKVDDVDVGQVASIELAPGGRSAKVTMELNGSVELVEGTTARVQQTSLLGEKYIALIRPTDAPAGAARLEAGATIALTSTSQAVEVEQVLGALSLLLNGGGIEQFKDISRELTAISVDRPEKVRAFLEEINTFVTQLDQRSDSITTALDGLDRLGKTLDGDRDKIAVALEDIQPGLSVLSDQREELVTMLKALDRLSTVTVRTLDASSDDIVRDFELLAPTLRQLGAAGSDLPKALEILVTYPFPDSVLNAVRGDYINTYLTLTLRSIDSEQPGIVGPSSVPVFDPDAATSPPSNNSLSNTFQSALEGASQTGTAASLAALMGLVQPTGGEAR